MLTNLFTGLKFYLPADLPRRMELYRYIIAYPFTPDPIILLRLFSNDGKINLLDRIDLN